MSENKRVPTRWWYLLALLLPIIACVGTSLLVYRNVPDLPGALGTLGVHNLTQVIVPGSAEIYIPKAGAYAVYYEYRTEFKSVRYARSTYPPDFLCQLELLDTGEEVQFTADYVEGKVYSTNNPERAGVLIMSASIPNPGKYKLTCRYSDGDALPRSVLAFGPNIIWEFFNLAAKPFAAFVCGLFVFVGACGISILIIAIVTSKRHESRRRMESQI